jgi:excinuclease UvrABC ATPase subunit
MSKTVVDGTCFRCKGTGSEKAMSIKQIAFIRQLFVTLVKLNVIVQHSNEWHAMVNTMNAHKNATALQSSKWASNKIEEYKNRKNRFLNASHEEIVSQDEQLNLFEHN